MNTTPNHFKLVEQIIDQFSLATVVNKAVPANSDTLYTQFELPLKKLELSGGGVSYGTLYLLNAALNAYMPASSASIADQHLYINIPRKCEHLPEHGIHQGLRKITHELLNATSERPDGYYVIDKARMTKTLPGVCHVDFEDLIRNLTGEYFYAHPEMRPDNPVLQSFYQLPHKTVVTDAEGLRHSGIVDDHLYGKFVKAYATQTGLPIAFHEGETSTAINNPILAALVATLDTGERGRAH